MDKQRSRFDQSQGRSQAPGQQGGKPPIRPSEDEYSKRKAAVQEEVPDFDDGDIVGEGDDVPDFNDDGDVEEHPKERHHHSHIEEDSQGDTGDIEIENDETDVRERRRQLRERAEAQEGGGRKIEVPKQWYATGFGLMKEAQEEADASRKSPRFYLKADQEKVIIFIDNKPFTVYEHCLKIGGSFQNYFTCLKGMGLSCPLCAKGNRRYFLAMWTVIDLTGWKDREGKLHGVGEPIIMPAKLRAAKKLQKYYSRNNGLAGSKFNVFRSSKQSESCGDDFAFIGKVDLSRYKNIKSFNFEEILRPLSSSFLLGKYADSEGYESSNDEYTTEEGAAF
jgi:hypothetical protein